MFSIVIQIFLCQISIAAAPVADTHLDFSWYAGTCSRKGNLTYQELRLDWNYNQDVGCSRIGKNRTFPFPYYKLTPTIHVELFRVLCGKPGKPADFQLFDGSGRCYGSPVANVTGPVCLELDFPGTTSPEYQVFTMECSKDPTASPTPPTSLRTSVPTVSSSPSTNSGFAPWIILVIIAAFVGFVVVSILCMACCCTQEHQVNVAPPPPVDPLNEAISEEVKALAQEETPPPVPAKKKKQKQIGNGI